MRRSQSAVEATAEGQLICHIKTQARQTEIVLFTESQKVNDKVKSDSCTARKKASKREKKSIRQMHVMCLIIATMSCVRGLKCWI